MNAAINSDEASSTFEFTVAHLLHPVSSALRLSREFQVKYRLPEIKRGGRRLFAISRKCGMLNPLMTQTISRDHEIANRINSAGAQNIQPRASGGHVSRAADPNSWMAFDNADSDNVVRKQHDRVLLKQFTEMDDTQRNKNITSSDFAPRSIKPSRENSTKMRELKRFPDALVQQAWAN